MITIEPLRVLRYLQERARPCGEIPTVCVDGAASDIGLPTERVAHSVASLVDAGALQSLDDTTLATMARGGMARGDFIAFQTPQGCTIYRVIPQMQLKQMLLAQRELLQRELSRLSWIDTVPIRASVVDQKLVERLATAARLVIERGLLADLIAAHAANVQLSEEDVRGLSGWSEHGIAERSIFCYGSNELRAEWPRWAAILAIGLAGLVTPQSRHRLLALRQELSEVDSALDAISNEAADPKVARRERIPIEVQREVWRRDEGRCVQCGSREHLHYDHIVPASKGGSSTVRNVQLLCESCNLAKGNRI